MKKYVSLHIILALVLTSVVFIVFFTSCSNKNDNNDNIATAINDAFAGTVSDGNVATDDNSVDSGTTISEAQDNTPAPEFDMTAFGDIEITGEYFVPNSAVPDMMSFLRDVSYIYYKEMVVAAYDFEDESIYKGAVEFFNTTTGESLYFEQFDYPVVLGSLSHDKNADSISLWTEDRFVHYYGFDGVNINTVALELPDYLKNVDLSNPTYSYDGSPFAGENAWWGATFEDGLALMPAESNSREMIFIPSTRLMDNIDFSEDVPPEFRVASFGDVQITDEGKFVVCSIVVPGSQTGHVGLYTLDTQTLEENFYLDVFAGMFADHRVLEDTLMITGYDTVTKIDIASGARETFSIPEETNKATFNYEDFYASSLNDSDKVIHAGDINSPIAKTSNEKTFIHQAIEHYLVLVNYSDDYGIKTVLIRTY